MCGNAASPPFNQPHALYDYLYEATGFPPLAPPEWRTSLDGSQMLHVERIQYTFMVIYFFRDELRLFDRLCQLSLVASANSSKSTYASTPEAATLVLHASPEMMGGTFEFVDHMYSRYFRYSHPFGIQHLNAIGDGQDIHAVAEVTLARIAAAQEAARQAVAEVRLQHHQWYAQRS